MKLPLELGVAALTSAKINILLLALDGVIDTDNPVISANVPLADVVENVLVFVALATCNTLPAGKLELRLALVITLPLVDGNVSVVVPATFGADSVTDPLVSPAMTTELMLIAPVLV